MYRNPPFEDVAFADIITPLDITKIVVAIANNTVPTRLSVEPEHTWLWGIFEDNVRDYLIPAYQARYGKLPYVRGHPKFKAWLVDWLLDRYAYVQQDIRNHILEDGTLKIYRYLDVPYSWPQTLLSYNDSHLGIYWTMRTTGARKYDTTSTGYIDRYTKKPLMRWHGVRLIAYIDNRWVDWRRTYWLQMLVDIGTAAEHEIRLYKGTPIKIDNICFPVIRRIPALRQWYQDEGECWCLKNNIRTALQKKRFFA
tara:strand:- start:240 stop:998 length:759 start_codon:yes stop_codon:yes gene_type:complete